MRIENTQRMITTGRFHPAIYHSSLTYWLLRLQTRVNIHAIDNYKRDATSVIFLCKVPPRMKSKIIKISAVEITDEYQTPSVRITGPFSAQIYSILRTCASSSHLMNESCEPELLSAYIFALIISTSLIILSSRERRQKSYHY